MLHQENKLQQQVNSPEMKKDFYIRQLLRIGVYKYLNKQLYELSINELQDVYIEYYVSSEDIAN